MTDHAHNFIDLTGESFGTVTVIEWVGREVKNEALWRCVCRCKRELIAAGSSLRRGGIHRCNKCRLKLMPIRARLLNSERAMKRRKKK